MSNRIDLLHQGMLGKIGEKISDATGATKISLASMAARKKVSASLTAAAPGRHWRKPDCQFTTRNDAVLIVSRKDAESMLMNKVRQSVNGRIPCVIIAVMGLLLPAGFAAANTETVAVRVTFVDPIEFREVNALQFGFLDQNLANLESVTVAPDSTVTDPADRVEGGPQVAASLTVTGTPGRAITIHVDAVVPGAGYSLADFRCNYNSGTEATCGGAGFSETSVASGTLLVGATLTGNGTAVAGAADGSFDITVFYQ